MLQGQPVSSAARWRGQSINDFLPYTVLALMCRTIVNNIGIHVMSKRWKESIYKSLNVVSLEFGGAKSVFVAVLAQVHPLQGFKMAAVEASV